MLHHATLPDGTVADVLLVDGRIAEVAASISTPAAARADEHDLRGYVLLPAPVEPHAHLDKALTADRVPNPRGDLIGAIEAWHAESPRLTVDDIATRARQAALLGLANGTTAIRTHVDVSTGMGLRAVEALLRVKAELASVVDVQVVTLVSVPTAGVKGAEHRALMRDALGMGADVVGGCPHLDDDPAGCIEVCLTAAADAGRPVDLHMDETLDPRVLHLPALAELVLSSGFPHGVTASHCVSLGMQDVARQRDVAELVAAAGVAVVALPQTNLFLQGRGIARSVPRGLTAIRALLDAEVVLAAGADNLRDPFNLMGRADPMETAALMVMAGHLSPAAAYHCVGAASRAAMGLEPVEIVPGAPADLLCIGGTSLAGAMAAAPSDRMVFKGGALVARSSVVQSFPGLD